MVLAGRLQEILLAADYASTRPIADSTRIGFIGHPYGGRTGRLGAGLGPTHPGERLHHFPPPHREEAHAFLADALSPRRSRGARDC